MQRKMLLITGTSLLLSILLSGCSQYQGDIGNKNIRQNRVKYDAFGNTLADKRFANDQMNEGNRINGRRLNNNNLIGSHKNYHMEMNEKMADQINQIDPSIKESYVLVTDNNAYVAVSMSEAGPSGSTNMMSRTGGKLLGKEQFDMNQRLNALATGEQLLTDELKKEIEAVVKNIKTDTDHVYVSADPEFVVRLNSYMNDVRMGYPIQGYIAEFNAMAQRIFPLPPNQNTQSDISAKQTSRKKIRWIYD